MRTPDPQWHFPYTRFQKLLELAAAVLALGGPLFLLLNWGSIPDQVPTHYGLSGPPDAWGSKNNLIVSAVLPILLYIPITLLSFYPQIWNHPWKATEENRAVIYQNLRSMILFEKLAMTAIFSYLLYTCAACQPLSGLFSLAAFGGLFGSMIYYLVKISRKLKAQHP